MAKRHEDWLWQADRDLRQARASAEGEFYEWACFAAQQSAEKALKAVFQHRGAEAWGHLLTDLVAGLQAVVPNARGLEDAAKELDKHYIAPRYPNSLPKGAPGQVYTKAEAERAIANADRILRFCKDHISG